MNASNTKLGAPTKADEDKHSSYIKLYLTAVQKDWIKQQQKAAGVKSTSRFLFKLLAEASLKRQISFAVNKQINTDLQLQLSKLGNNVNQAIAFLHSTGDTQYIEQTKRELELVMMTLQQVSAEVRTHADKQPAPEFPH
ncbi:hypothetical protein [Agarivorans aestuarii]|uniref:Bacterial mobilisation domain-containing protein n=1 Tax=Agarivorans aestuarii TaxID=1563703 RepID=A0ABU7G1M8_9ALTE|nr:hypothetical protein [Agarivorans aestuarii]MEE1672859.1 hypothetical protein [Agarivorans aestuarii]